MDTYNEYNPLNPINEIECEPQTELEEQQDWNQELVRKNKKLVAELEKLSEIEQCLSIFGKINYEQRKEKKTILNKYIK